MSPREIILKVLSGKRPDRIPVALVGGGMWSVHHHGISFEEMAKDSSKMAGMLVAVVHCGQHRSGQGSASGHGTGCGEGLQKSH